MFSSEVPWATCQWMAHTYASGSSPLGRGDEYCGADCVATCDFQAECDVNRPCANDACCSKAGFCGLGPDSEFCRNKKVKRPSADFNGYTPLNKIIGYYGGWSRNRKCHTLFPEQIPLGIYTHLNYAFATIDPETFEVKLASTTEADLVSIAIGGWAYNDPGPTRTTFSDLAASHDAQKRFYKSLISFLSTYNLDGVEIDWEYPGFEECPCFLAASQAALKSAGRRDRLTITLPASYRFSQYFDIVKLEKYVDFFNMMTYDLHGAWDRGNKWVGPYLNAHTNLTEIQHAMDLLWRNKIPSNKVILGTGFYGRAFTATSESCMEPGCTYESAASKGPYSNENGILLNSEIDNQWVAYDDEETLELKAQSALGQALGGIMVWAVSHDSTDRHFTDAFLHADN
ncbi:glycoside hydrolase superfamily [Aspergillus desertorum]